MRILAVKTHAFGDALLTTPAVSGLVASGHRVTVLAGPSSLPVWQRFPGLEGVIASPAPCSIPKLLFWSVSNRQKGFDRAIHFGSSQLAARWSGYIAGCSVTSGAFSDTGFGRTLPAAADYCRIAEVRAVDLKPVFPITSEEMELAYNITGDEPYVVFAPGGGRNPREFVPEKRWPVERWKKVMEFALQKGFRTFAVGGRDESSYFSQLPCENLAGKLTWGETGALIKGAAAFAGNDSGPAHLAVASSTPAVVLFGPSDPDALFARGTVSPVTASVSCSPCYSNSVFRRCTGAGDCMTSIDTGQVTGKLEEILSK
ncbi:hypothetical protein CSA37_03235 [Candidatus Fermentibacteria bacterium]|nr:MAG: hypothetical protein CSA37_03235 [Candidatus Fermentibacteria bacterium]